MSPPRSPPARAPRLFSDDLPSPFRFLFACVSGRAECCRRAVGLRAHFFVAVLLAEHMAVSCAVASYSVFFFWRGGVGPPADGYLPQQTHGPNLGHLFARGRTTLTARARASHGLPTHRGARASRAYGSPRRQADRE